MRLDTLRARLTWWYVIALTLTLSAFAALLYVWLGRTLYRHHDSELLEDAGRIAILLRQTPLDEQAIEHAIVTLDSAPRLLLVRNGDGELLYRSALLRVAEPTIGHHEALIHAAAHAPRDPEFFTITLEESGPVRFICTPIERTPAAYVQVGHELGDVPTTMHAVAIASIVLVPIVIVLTSFGGWMIAGRALAPIDTMNATLQAIGATDLSKRIDVRPGDRELKSLVGTINGLLGRLDRAFSDLRDFTADASHQLQTPLTVMKGAIELARRAPPSQGLLDDLDEEITDMSAVVAELQSLSLADADSQHAARTTIDFSELCRDATEILEALAESKGVHVTADIAPNITLSGDPGKLKQVVLNLGDNAIKYTPAGGHISLRVGVARDGHAAVLDVSDSGVGIAEEHLPRIFERFFRVPGAEVTRGTGLGLAIAKRFVELHGGTIAVSSRAGAGTTFSVRLPV
jgi:signal transduction histidine kinase